MFFIPNLLTAQQAQAVRQLLSKARFEDGKLSAGAGSDYQKNNLQADTEDENCRQAQLIIQKTLAANAQFRTLAAPRKVRPVTFNLYRENMYYRDHTDHSILPGNPMVRGDLSMTLFLSEPDSYAGGELVVDCDSERAVSIKLPLGHAVIYDACTMHRVNTVTSGERLGAVTSIESMINNPMQRELIGELAQLTRWVQDQAPQSKAERRANKIYANLLRMWSET